MSNAGMNMSGRDMDPPVTRVSLSDSRAVADAHNVAKLFGRVANIARNLKPSPERDQGLICAAQAAFMFETVPAIAGLYPSDGLTRIIKHKNFIGTGMVLQSDVTDVFDKLTRAEGQILSQQPGRPALSQLQMAKRWFEEAAQY